MKPKKVNTEAEFLEVCESVGERSSLSYYVDHGHGLKLLKHQIGGGGREIVAYLIEDMGEVERFVQRLDNVSALIYHDIVNIYEQEFDDPLNSAPCPPRAAKNEKWAREELDRAEMPEPEKMARKAGKAAEKERSAGKEL